VQDELVSGRLVAPTPGVLTVSDAYFFSYPESSERSEALIAFESWLAGITQP
jgi:LysR family glycine cleavage system transcriptional activator